MHDQPQTPWWRTRGGVALLGFGLVAAFYVLREHYEHALGALPYLLLLACPLMHLFMHHGHGGHQGHHRADGRAAQDAEGPGRVQGGAS
ncbi:DUF2933 domain-containing protein [Dankookia rubra]|uniref:DUF2933 domain-containing protein n=1 Tax=Dankookia rubra TaxID=1442381 RepID=A0A4R5QHR7_9PROT|nr:DUF2933 domain-containing protein [Dankookia rubra]TDH62097.1 DUF2933 domain-containing protein [Dankookia rubra]